MKKKQNFFLISKVSANSFTNNFILHLKNFIKYYLNIHPIIFIMSTEHKPVLRRHYTFESESIDSPKMRQRTKTASLLCPSNHKED